MSERFICIDRWGNPFDGVSYTSLEAAQDAEKIYGDMIAGIIRVVVENGKIKHCHEVGSVDH